MRIHPSFKNSLCLASLVSLRYGQWKFHEYELQGIIIKSVFILHWNQYEYFITILQQWQFLIVPKMLQKYFCEGLHLHASKERLLKVFIQFHWLGNANRELTFWVSLNIRLVYRSELWLAAKKKMTDGRCNILR